MTPPGPFVIVMMFALRIGVPILVTIGLAYLYDYIAARWSTANPSDNHGRQSPKYDEMDQPSGVPFRDQCVLQEAVNVANTRWSNIPCWLALQLTEGRIPEECLNCPTFHDDSLEKSQLADA